MKNWLFAVWNIWTLIVGAFETFVTIVATTISDVVRMFFPPDSQLGDQVADFLEGIYIGGLSMLDLMVGVGMPIFFVYVVIKFFNPTD